MPFATSFTTASPIALHVVQQGFSSIQQLLYLQGNRPSKDFPQGMTQRMTQGIPKGFLEALMNLLTKP
jgi:hypothetical protein